MTEPNLKSLKSSFLKTMVERKHFNQCTDVAALDELAAKGDPILGYIGFDATADSLTIGNLIPIMMLRRLQQTGHKPIVLMGGGTSQVGDPSDKDKERSMLSLEVIESNMKSQQRVFSRLLKFGDGKTDAVMVNNADWLCSIKYVEFLREIGRFFSINRMVGFDFVKRRLDNEQPLSFLEFNYMIMQGYDFYYLYKNKNCVLQMGGSDQWGNIINGVELIKKALNKPAYGLTTNLITTASGQKMGKSAGNAIWLNENRLSNYDFWQFWRNTEDADVGRFMRMFTDIPIADIEQFEKAQGAAINEAKKVLADEVTKLIRGADAAVKSRQTAEETFERGGLGEDLPKFRLKKGTNILDALVEAKCFDSKSAARREIGKAIKFDDEVITDDKFEFTRSGKLSASKKKHVLIEIE